MKRNIICLAALLAATSAAQAQSSVTLFGLLDLNVSHYKAGSAAGGGSRTDMNDGTVNGLNGSRWGMRVTEDLGGGLRASALMEGGILADTGAAAQGGRSFGRQVFVALGMANVGEVRLGRQYVLSDSVMFMSNPFGNALTLNPSTAVTNMGRSLSTWLNAPRADNVFQVQTASLGGLTLAAQVAPGEGTADRFHGVRANYQVGQFATAISYEWNKSRTTGEDTNKSLTFAANYNFGPVKLLGGVQRNSDLTTTSGNGAAVGVSNLIVTGDTTLTMQDLNGYTLGAEVPAGAFLLGANYTLVNYEAANGDSLDLGKLAFGARYSLSKNTFLYTSASFAAGDLKNYITQERVIQAGIRMAF